MAGTPLTNPNWATETTDTVVRVVGQIRDKATTPIVYAARGLVFGLIAVFLGLFAVVVLLIGLTRVAQVLLDLLVAQDQAVYLSYLIVGGMLCVVGMFLFKKRNAAASK